jgi:hypothetical protein
MYLRAFLWDSSNLVFSSVAPTWSSATMALLTYIINIYFSLLPYPSWFFVMEKTTG